MNHFKPLLILTASAALLGLEVNEAIANVSNISGSLLDSQIYSAEVSEKRDRHLTNSQGTLKKGSAISVDPDQVRGIPKAEARTRFILNKIYLIQEDTTADDLFIVDEKANKWVVKDVLYATEDATNKSAALIVSCNANVWAVIENF
ncbi:hypothetical protein [Microcoleus sp. herbarium12]|uniref:hypothetical protein n=1 Tax=Microcoleus sp. herbarium12 TaxID=3055437 RepID=UPI002FD1DF6A